MEEKLRKRKLSIVTSLLIAFTLTITLSPPTLAYSNGGYSADPSNREYGTELPDNGGAPDGITDS